MKTARKKPFFLLSLLKRTNEKQIEMHINTKFNDANSNEKKTEKEKKLRNFFLYISTKRRRRKTN